MDSKVLCCTSIVHTYIHTVSVRVTVHIYILCLWESQYIHTYILCLWESQYIYTYILYLWESQYIYTYCVCESRSTYIHTVSVRVTVHVYILYQWESLSFQTESMSVLTYFFNDSTYFADDGRDRIHQNEWSMVRIIISTCFLLLFWLQLNLKRFFLFLLTDCWQERRTIYFWITSDLNLINSTEIFERLTDLRMLR